MNNRSKCAVLVPAYGAIEPQTEELLHVLAQRGYAVRTLRGASQVDLARSSMATDALRDGFQETFWIDADQTFDPDDVDRIRSLNLPFCAALYVAKGPKRFVGKLTNCDKVVFGKGGGTVCAEYVGMGFTHVRREVYEAIIERCRLEANNGGYDGKRVIPFFIPHLEPEPNGERCYLSEDYSFCSRAKYCGFPPMVDTRIKVGHVGKKVYTWDDLAPDTKLSSLEVEMLPTGEIVLSGQTTKEQDMSITREDLLTELGGLEQQAAQCRETMERADLVKAEAAKKFEAIHGATQVVQHLLKKIEAKEQLKEQADGQATASGGPGSPPAGTDQP